MKTWIFIGLLLALISGGAYYYYSSTQSTIQELVENNATLSANVVTLTNANEVNLDTIDSLQLEFQQIQEDFNRTQERFQEIRQQNTELRERLGRHEIGALAASRPALVENIINNASENALRCFELLSGAPLTEQERNATNAREFNSECPFLWTDSNNP